MVYEESAKSQLTLLFSYHLTNSTATIFGATIYIKIKKVIKYLTKLIQNGDRSQCMRKKNKNNCGKKIKV